MNESIIEAIDAEIARLVAARAALSSVGYGKSKPQSTPKTKKKRNLSPEGRKRIVEAVKRRWAAKKAEAKKAAKRD